MGSCRIIHLLDCRLKITLTSNLKLIISFLVLLIQVFLFFKSLSIAASKQHTHLTLHTVLRLVNRPSATWHHGHKNCHQFVTFFYIVDNSVAKNKILLPHFYNLAKLLRPRPCPTPRPYHPHARLGKTLKLAPLEGGKACHGGDVCVVCCVLIYILIPM
jgi:hypothetical protein